MGRRWERGQEGRQPHGQWAQESLHCGSGLEFPRLGQRNPKKVNCPSPCLPQCAFPPAQTNGEAVWIALRGGVKLDVPAGASAGSWCHRPEVTAAYLGHTGLSRLLVVWDREGGQ